MEVALRVHEMRGDQHQFMAPQGQVAATVRNPDDAVLGFPHFGEMGDKALPHPRDHQIGLGAGQPPVQRGNDVRVGM